MEIGALDAGDEALVQAVAALLVEGFREQSPEAWPDLASALDEVRESLGEGRLSLVARGAAGEPLGWIGAIRSYGGNAWELHPLVVAPAGRRQGVGRALVAALEARVAAEGATTLYLGSDDEAAQTTLGGVDLYPHVWEHVARIRNLRGHPYEFYQKCGFHIVGVLPDANGPGRPDILMAKRVARL